MQVASPGPEGALDLRSLDLDATRALMARATGRPRLAERVFGAVHRAGVASVAELPIARAARDALAGLATIRPLAVERVARAEDGTTKVLFGLADGARVETVVIPNPNTRAKWTVCLSSQAGCSLGCRFCATGARGGGRNLSVGEIVGQLYQASALTGRRLSDVVFMGMGEPLLNDENVYAACRLLRAPGGRCISRQRITISTAGVVPAVRRFVARGEPWRLVFSIHAGSSARRAQLMPIERVWPLEELLDACRELSAARGGERLVFEWVAIPELTMNEAAIDELLEAARGLPFLLNVIPFNPVPGAAWRRPTYDEVMTFVRAVGARGVPFVVRRSGGVEVAAGCGQLAAQEV